MKRLREKWNSSQGASILVALLLMLICMMVASAVLMAAASNAGKTTRRSLEEHQKYLTLSSALRLVCGEIEGSSYTGKYSYTPEPVPELVQKQDENGNPMYGPDNLPIMIETDKTDHYRHIYTQTKGTYTCELNDPELNDPELNTISEVLPLQDQLDCLFGLWLNKDSVASPDSTGEYYFHPQTGSTETTLTVEAPDFDPVTINLSLNEFGYISLTASLSGDDFTVAAELMPVSPSGNDPVSLNDVFALESTEGEHTTKTVSWKLNWIAKKKEAQEP